MPPFGPKRFEIQLTDEEKSLAEERERLQNDLYKRMKVLTKGHHIPFNRHVALEQSVVAEYAAEGQSDGDKTRAKVQTGANPGNYPIVSVYTAEAQSLTRPQGDWIRQLTLRPTGKDDEAVMYDYDDPNHTWSDREATEILRAGYDTIAILEAYASEEESSQSHSVQ